MAITDIIHSKYDLPDSDRKKLAALISEAKARGLSIPEEIITPTKIKWPMDSNGFFIRRDGWKFDPYPDQEDFVLSTARFVGFHGSRGSGKSTGGAQKSLQKIMQGEPGIVMNPDFENLKKSTWPEFRDWIPWKMVIPKQRHRANPEWEPHQPFNLVFMNRVSVMVTGVKNPDSARGPNKNWLWYDEGQRDEDGGSFRTAIASIRIGKDPQVWVSYTPKGKLHWTYTFFEERNIPEEASKLFEKEGGGRELIESYHGTLEDNKKNLDPGFCASLLASYTSKHEIAREIYGEYADEGGVLGDRNWFSGKVINSIPQEVTIKARTRYWDLAASEKKISGKNKNDPDETVGTLESWDGDNFYIENQVSGYWAWKDIKENILQTALRDGPYVPIYIEQEPGAGGINQVEEIKSFIQDKVPAFRVLAHRPEGDKIMRANPWFAEAKVGKVWLIYGEWVEPFLRQLDGFPNLRHDDKIDSVSGARHTVAPIITWRNIKFLKV